VLTTGAAEPEFNSAYPIASVSSMPQQTVFCWRDAPPDRWLPMKRYQHQRFIPYGKLRVTVGEANS